MHRPLHTLHNPILPRIIQCNPLLVTMRIIAFPPPTLHFNILMFHRLAIQIIIPALSTWSCMSRRRADVTMIPVAVRIPRILVRGRALERGSEPRYESAENVLDGRSARANDGDGGLDGGVRGCYAVAVCFALECVEEPKETRDADCDDDEAEGEEGDCDEFALEGHLEVPDYPGGDAE